MKEIQLFTKHKSKYWLKYIYVCLTSMVVVTYALNIAACVWLCQACRNHVDLQGVAGEAYLTACTNVQFSRRQRPAKRQLRK